AFYSAASTVQSRAGLLSRWKWYRKVQQQQTALRQREGLLDRFLALIPFISPDKRAIVLKDVRLFWRDTTQWGQTVVLFGLLAVYILNLRHFGSQITSPFWSNLVSHLNLFACALNLATITTRFVYPQFSLEGKRGWIIGMAPMGLPHVVLTKLALATVASLCITLSLTLLSAWMLKMDRARTFDLGASAVVMTITLNSLATGLGALYPNLKEDNPNRIVAGFGGTFCLVASFVYILLSVLILSITSAYGRDPKASLTWMAAGRIAFLTLSVAAGLIPLRLAIKKVTRFEF
ncbi:MAG: hypothetical protein N3G20_02375, partial [Verrucomicrobiae bacterium]|nr:hypothetical protein [Verrucomicrobiae bacterium]